MIDPAPYAFGFELGGVQGEIAVRGMGVAFLMWNVTYPAFVVSPRRFRVLGWVVLAQQIVGLVGESWILAGLAGWEGPLVSSIVRFIAFDAFGLLIMLVSFAFMMASERREGLRRTDEGDAL